MLAQRGNLFRSILSELQQSVKPPRTPSENIIGHFRAIAEKIEAKNDAQAAQDYENAILFLKSQREHKRLLERYNPLFDLTAEERIKATARRVGLDMPIQHKPE
ncbi:hypothetical protein D9613_005204 [Agrocybe pediades]|uniref:ATP synthase assembly factor FMC1, mitochondrial n=1 Tax=Agrocybe pediades TaxID=84607 RepID=A0A8H4QX80_9AGAR|nr:hypothetical protein D9613_005204 [Agrocybe pediades]KAF9569046.1 hypothetical protein CPC08DRAFT_757240 [Agrocybe pediades]